MHKCHYCGAISFEDMNRGGRLCTECHRLAYATYPQQDDHCWLVADGWMWKITAIQQGAIIIECEHPAGGVIVATLTGTDDWSAYCDDAARIINEQAAGLASVLSGPDVTQ